MKIINKNYGSIPHLSISKLNQKADKKISKGQEEILTKKVRDWRDLIIVTEKIDGANVGVINIKGEIIAITRSGNKAEDSKYEHHRMFHDYVFKYKKKFEWLPENWRICGEWVIMAHGTIYRKIRHLDKFLAFDIFDQNNERVNYMDFEKLCFKYDIITTPLLHIGSPISIINAIKLLGDGKYGDPESPEGVVYRCERYKKVEFLAKYVAENKEDGKYLKDNIYF